MKEKVIKYIGFINKFIKANKALSMKMLAGLIVIIAIIVIASCLDGEKYGNSTGNNNNLGIAAREGRWIYYIEVDGDEQVGICRVKTNGKKTEKVIDGCMSNLNVVDNYIYCLEYDEDEGQSNLIKVKTNGKNKKILARDVDEELITVVDEYVYYFKNNNLYRVETNGTDREKISSKSISYYQIEGDWIYYIYNNDSSEYIAKMELDGEENQRIAKADEDIHFESLYVKGGKIYYITSKYNDYYDSDYYLYKMSKKGKNPEKICKIDTNIQNINMQEDGIYYTVTESYDSYLIKSMKYNGTEKTTIKKEEMAEAINIAEDWILFFGVNDDYDTVMKMVSIDGKEEKNL